MYGSFHVAGPSVLAGTAVRLAFIHALALTTRSTVNCRPVTDR